MARVILTSLTLVLLACTNQSQKASIKFIGNYNICDTCKTTIFVHHDECTMCGEITVDSGTVYLTNQILKAANALINYKTDSFLVSPNTIYINELYFADTSYFAKLYNNPKTFDKKYFLTGKVVAVKHRHLSDSETEVYPSLFFAVDKATEIYTTNKCKTINDVIACTNKSGWAKTITHDEDIVPSGILYFNFDTTTVLVIELTPESWIKFPVKISHDSIIVNWEINYDSKYNFPWINEMNRTPKNYIGKPFMFLKLINDSTLQATYPNKQLIKKINSTDKMRVLFPDIYTIFNN